MNNQTSSFNQLIVDSGALLIHSRYYQITPSKDYSEHAMSKRSFLPHGSINIAIDNDLVTLDIKGPCNIEFFELMTEKLISLRPQLNMDNYTYLVILHDEALATPEALLYFTNYLKTVQVRAVAINLQYTDSPSITEAICHKTYNDSGVKHRFFFDSISAKTWLRRCMATA